MFVLRQIDKNGSESNLSLSDYYSITYKEQDKDKFDHALSSMDIPDQKKCYAYIGHGDGSEYYLYKDQYYYIMTDGGKTFANVSYRGER